MYGAVKKQCLSFDSMKKEICKIADFLKNNRLKNGFYKFIYIEI